MAPKSNSERQRDRRVKEKQWLKDHGYTSWEALHTKLVNGDLTLNTTLQGELKKVDSITAYPVKGKS